MNPFWHCWWLESNLVQFVEKQRGENNQRYFCVGNFFVSAFLVKFLSCKYYDVLFFFNYYYFLFLLFFFSFLMNQCSTHSSPTRTLHLQSYQPPTSSFFLPSSQIVYSSSFFLTFTSVFSTWLKRNNCAKSLSTQDYHTNVLNVLWVVEQRKDI